MTDAPLHPFSDSAPVAADAATIQQVPAGVSLAHAKPLAKVFAHPSARLFETVVAAVAPAVTTFCADKQVPIEEAHHPDVVRYALKNFRPKTLRAVMRGEPQAIRAVQDALNRALDVGAVMRMLLVARAMQDGPTPTLIELLAEAETIWRNWTANDTGTMQIWKDPVEMLVSHIEKEAAREDTTPPVTLPAGSVSVRLPLKEGVR